MVIPLEITLIYTIISLFVFLFIGILLFMEEQTILKTSFAFILCFINGVFSYMTCLSYFGIDLYGFTNEGVVVSNPMYDLAPFGMFFLMFSYFSIIFALYCLYMFYLKPWDEMMKSYNLQNNPWYENSEV